VSRNIRSTRIRSTPGKALRSVRAAARSFSHRCRCSSYAEPGTRDWAGIKTPRKVTSARRTCVPRHNARNPGAHRPGATAIMSDYRWKGSHRSPPCEYPLKRPDSHHSSPGNATAPAGRTAVSAFAFLKAAAAPRASSRAPGPLRPQRYAAPGDRSRAATSVRCDTPDNYALSGRNVLGYLIGKLLLVALQLLFMRGRDARPMSGGDMAASRYRQLIQPGERGTARITCTSPRTDVKATLPPPCQWRHRRRYCYSQIVAGRRQSPRVATAARGRRALRASTILFYWHPALQNITHMDPDLCVTTASKR
jgi:hypothetical protein